MDEKNSIRANLLEKLIEKLMMGEFEEGESAESEMPEQMMDEKDPKAEVKMLAIEAEPKKKLMGV